MIMSLLLLTWVGDPAVRARWTTTQLLRVVATDAHNWNCYCYHFRNGSNLNESQASRLYAIATEICRIKVSVFRFLACVSHVAAALALVLVRLLLLSLLFGFAGVLLRRYCVVLHRLLYAVRSAVVLLVLVSHSSISPGFKHGGSA
jgi:hypothetical protein